MFSVIHFHMLQTKTPTNNIVLDQRCGCGLNEAAEPPPIRIMYERSSIQTILTEA